MQPASTPSPAESPSPLREHAALRDNVRLLGEMLGETLREHGGAALFDRIERIRRLAVDARAGRADAAALPAELAALDGDALLHVVRAFNQFLNLANIAEQHHRVRVRRQAALACRWPPEDGTLLALAAATRRAGIAPAQLAAAVRDLSVELVLTAHPTEVTRRTLMHKYDEIARRLAELDHADLTPAERADARAALLRTVSAAWHTDEIRRTRPTPVDEAKWGFATIEQTLWQAVPVFLRELDRWLREHTGEPLPLDCAPVRFASWMGGDRDGNPFVTHRVTREVILLARWQATELFLRDVEQLQGELSMHEASAALRAVVGDSREPYRVLMKELRDRLRNTRAWIEARLNGQKIDAGPIVDSDADLLAPLQLAHDSLVACGMGRIADGLLADTLRRVAVFGSCLVRLDIRQESTRHAETLAAITQWLGLGDYAAWSERERQQFLLAELDNRRPLVGDDFRDSPLCGETVREALDTFDALAQLPRSAFGAYVISMARAPSDVLAVALLQKIAGVRQPLPVVPLFETLDDLEHAAATVDALLALPAYRAHIGDYQQVMIGYSDSAKDAGYLAASWAQYRAQEAITAVCARHGVRLELFHGRGGSVSRGGTPTRQALLSQPPGSVQGRIRVTEQGEMIRFKFGLAGVALENLEVYVASTLEATLLPPPAPEPAWRGLMDELTRVAVAGYRDVVRGEPRFVDYLRTVTPEQELATLALGSRPAKRRAQGGLETLRAIPWVFAWTQIRLMLPAWLGTDNALAFLREHPEQREQFDAMLARWPYFQAVIDMLEMVLAKADNRIAAYYERQLADDALKPLGSALRARLDATVRDLLELTGKSSLLAGNPVMQWSIAVRNPYTDPLHLLQAELVRRHRLLIAENHEVDPAIDLALKVTIAGIAAGMRNTG
ncbi:MAG: phosphoenolpyruvate carboxylase [Gammaproteobacteria bacterium]